MIPVLLPPNPVQHFYRGGDRIAELRGIVPETDRQPEEWLGATVTRFGEPTIGLAVTADGSVLRDLVAADPEGWTGRRAGSATVSNGTAVNATVSHASDTGILVKLLDARQRLPVHVHPDREFARSHLDCPYGKTEAWYVLDAVDDGAVYLGWTEDVDPIELAARRDAQDSEWMLAHMNHIPVTPGMGILVPAGTAHAIGEGVFVMEVQEPTDFSILLEWSVTTSTREESHLDLGFDRVMPAVSHAAMTQGRIAALTLHDGLAAQKQGADGAFAPAPLLVADADPFFRLLGAQHREPGERTAMPQGFAVVLITEGEGSLVAGRTRVDVRRGEAYAVPHAFGAWQLEGAVTALCGLPGTDRVGQPA